MIEQMLIDNNRYKLILKYDEVAFDYYTEVCVELILNNERFTLFKDNLLELRNTVKIDISDIKDVNNDLDESKLGILLNEYYLSLYDDMVRPHLILDASGEWIGVNYCISIGRENAIWLYKHKKKIVFRVTPIFSHFEDEGYVDKFNEFRRNYKDIFRNVVSVKELKKAKEIILELYKGYF